MLEVKIPIQCWKWSKKFVFRSGITLKSQGTCFQIFGGHHVLTSLVSMLPVYHVYALQVGLYDLFVYTLWTMKICFSHIFIRSKNIVPPPHNINWLLFTLLLTWHGSCSHAVIYNSSGDHHCSIPVCRFECVHCHSAVIINTCIYRLQISPFLPLNFFLISYTESCDTLPRYLCYLPD